MAEYLYGRINLYALREDEGGCELKRSLPAGAGGACRVVKPCHIGYTILD